MLATSWIAKDLVRPIWQRMPVKTYKREELAKRAGIPASNLSSLNTGGLPMTIEQAQKIVDAVPGVTLADLGAPEEVVAVQVPGVLDRLQSLQAEADRARGLLERVLLALDQAGIALPDAPAEARSAATARPASRRKKPA